MYSLDTLEKQTNIFGSLLLIPNKLQIILDLALAKYDLTAKQWFLTAVIHEFFKEPPTLGEVAEVMGSSHQNVKQLASKLQQKGFLELEKDHKDGRVLRLKLTDKVAEVAKIRHEETLSFFKKFFSDFTAEEINCLHDGIYKLYDKTLIIEKELKGNGERE
ncbi:MarR family winged helix-turn-helix transcriptional regulator [Alkaliphilus serpentinus]|uniref:MarR family transcriptional regulator n=1 Tax=Alkaliphilus serpentinus TaxID=1482731 RepID=A0A833MF51_9FIRM|nr:MarR family transcriptional regulator [Alkaliphilus serpentinus]KAB3532815.1 MarR family transcriptional regulator [Alkaliphilus serpentinus]